MAFIFTTVLLAIVPLVVVGCAVRWIQKRAEERDALLESSPTKPVTTAVVIPPDSRRADSEECSRLFSVSR